MGKKRKSLEEALAEPVVPADIDYIDEYAGLSWQVFLTRCNAAAIGPHILKCIACAREFVCAPPFNTTDNPHPLWCHLDSKQNQEPHPHKKTLDRWTLQWDEGSVGSATQAARPAPWNLEAEETRLEAIEKPASSGTRPLVKRPKTDGQVSEKPLKQEETSRWKDHPKFWPEVGHSSADGRMICAEWAKRRCPDPCSANRFHGCPGLLRNGKLCGSKEHRSVQDCHNPLLVFAFKPRAKGQPPSKRVGRSYEDID